MASNCLENSPATKLTEFDSLAFRHFWAVGARWQTHHAQNMALGRFDTCTAHHIRRRSPTRQRHWSERPESAGSNPAGGTNRAVVKLAKAPRSDRGDSVGSNPTRPTILLAR